MNLTEQQPLGSPFSVARAAPEEVKNCEVVPMDLADIDPEPGRPDRTCLPSHRQGPTGAILKGRGPFGAGAGTRYLDVEQYAQD